MDPKNKRVVIVGAGFGGITTCKVLSKSRDLDIHLIDRRNYHLFQPLLYQVAMAGLNPSDIAIPIRRLFSKNKNVTISLAEVEEVDVEKNRLKLDNAWIDFDYLILACGAKHFYFGNDEWEEVAPGLKNIEQATEIRRRILTAFEMAEKASDPEVQRSFLTFVVVGGGPTGVELAGAIAEMASNTLKKDYKRADLSHTRVVLVESGPRLLSAFPEKLSAVAEEDLKKMGVEVFKGTLASDLGKEGLKVNKEWLATKTILWAAGVKPSGLTESVKAEKDRQGRIVVEKDLSIKENPNVFVIGDQASCSNGLGGVLPGIAPVAIQQGQFVGKLLLSELKGKPRSHFKYFDKGIMATIGRSKAIVSVGSFKIHGFIAWLMWVIVHILYLMRFKNKFFVFSQWVWSYFRFGRGARLIVHKTWRFYSGKKINYD